MVRIVERHYPIDPSGKDRKGNLFEDAEIKKILGPAIKQLTSVSCTYGAIANLTGLQSLNRYSATTRDPKLMQEDLIQAGFTPIEDRWHNGLKNLGKILQKKGPAIVYITDHQIGNHVIVVDRVGRNGITLRDSYHGWQIKVTKAAFLRRLYYKGTLQANRLVTA